MTTYGAPIPVDGVRPGWLERCKKIPLIIQWCNGILSTHGGWTVDHVDNSEDVQHRWSAIEAIRLPADHWAYRAISIGMTPWAGGDSAPEDWDHTAPILYRDGTTQTLSYRYESIWEHDGDGSDAIGYTATRKAEPAPVEGDKPRTWSCSCGWSESYTKEDIAEYGEPSECQVCYRERLVEVDEPTPTPTPNTVTLPRMSEEAAKRRWGDPNEHFNNWPTRLAVLRDLGLIRDPDPTPLDRFAAAHPEIDLGDEAVRVAVEVALEWRE